MEYNDAIMLLEDMKSRYNDGFSSSDKSVLEELHRVIFGKEIKNKSCGDCFRDAYILITIHLKKTKTMPKPTSNYTLKAGGMIRRPGENRAYTNPLPNDEIPEKFLADFPHEIAIFASYPTDWEARVALRKTGKVPEGEISQEECRATIESLRAEVARKDEEIAALTAEKEALSQAVPETSYNSEVENLKLELGSVSAELTSANEEIKALSEENAKLKEQISALQSKPATKTSRKTKEETPEE